ncbi:MAG: 4-hydroxybenzoyl-CoA reductase subunit beta [Rubrivivax sp. SCN 71-131]|jgi:4-hydroxybenzoyl-CoA reductase subunit beta|nr:MAG: 4-hydroxybenzoyl-CoA reductase subunit beta [Rubrivivax sp. SCN 71-131]
MNLMPEFRCHRPASLDEAVKLKSGLPQSRFLGGGTDLLVNLRRGLGEPSDLIDLGGIAEFATVRRVDGALWIGAGITLAELARRTEITDDHPAVAAAALAVAGPTHRASATLGGNLCQDTRCIFYNQSDWWREGNGFCLKYKGDRCHVVVKSDRCYATYHGDIAPVLMVLGAEAAILSPSGMRRVPLETLYREDGAKYLTLAADEALAAVVLPPAAGRRVGYEKARVRDAVDFPLAGVAVALRREGEALAALRVAITGTNSAPLLLATSGLVGKPWDEAAARSLDDVMRKTANVLRTTVTGAKYRRRALHRMARGLIDRLWTEAGTP